MRLDRFNPANIRVRGGGSGGGGGFPGGGAGGVGCGTLVLVLIGALVFGVDPGQMLSGLDQNGGTTAPATQQRSAPQSAEELCTQNQYATEACNALQSLNQTWQPEFQRAGIRFAQPELVFYSGGTDSGCGAAQSAMGPFYCPADHGIYIDTSFYDQMAQQLGAKGDFARYYVIAHEYGHHIQKLTGVADAIRSAQQQNPRASNQLQVRMELQADCYAGVWAGKNRNLIDPGDFEEGMTAASAIGDDTLMRNAGRQVDAESFTHGSSAQRMEALRAGMESGNDSVCDRYVQLS
ncbi:MAG: KPN_02809 family neutral zinc metallopeptidase [Tsuneonella suprasediminis]|uniref:Zinc metalloprotease n=1 Tax=Tsuneonella suprasediminis TaxID=2306996 RepID=A0A419QZP8_9SPHN|nr:neutral zinc metallopeptidase [Tsuneonella suprasediminis]RJX66311.1 zinc metalloprotease [Tsuneonella suprasediminis]UBS32016.1 neutral zinc metallopeptidase [Altererythrobacter sp. N1]